jgi:hypothetical protein
MLEIGHWKNTDVHPFSTRNKIIRDTVPQKTLLGNVEITVIRVFFIFITSLFSQAND